MDVDCLEPTHFGPEFPGHSGPVYAHELKGLSLSDRVHAFKARVDDYLISQTDRLAGSEALTPFPLAVMACVGVELLGSYNYGDPGDNSNRHFQKVIEDMDPALGEERIAPDGKQKPLSDFIYFSFRNSLIHGYRGKWVFITHREDEAKNWTYGKAERALVVNIYWFYREYKRAYEAYFNSLANAQDPTSDPLLTFDKTFKEHFKYWL